MVKDSVKGGTQEQRGYCSSRLAPWPVRVTPANPATRILQHQPSEPAYAQATHAMPHTHTRHRDPGPTVTDTTSPSAQGAAALVRRAHADACT